MAQAPLAKGYKHKTKNFQTERNNYTISAYQPYFKIQKRNIYGGTRQTHKCSFLCHNIQNVTITRVIK